jgi:hypothetical protein
MMCAPHVVATLKCGRAAMFAVLLRPLSSQSCTVCTVAPGQALHGWTEGLQQLTASILTTAELKLVVGRILTD